MLLIFSSLIFIPIILSSDHVVWKYGYRVTSNEIKLHEPTLEEWQNVTKCPNNKILYNIKCIYRGEEVQINLDDNQRRINIAGCSKDTIKYYCIDPPEHQLWYNKDKKTIIGYNNINQYTVMHNYMILCENIKRFENSSKLECQDCQVVMINNNSQDSSSKKIERTVRWECYDRSFVIIPQLNYTIAIKLFQK